ncbi:MAG: T9SS type A sorting domain-containing protein [Sphingobacteriales bacterium]|nr:MAG: T9SS type A sorting domain-containing protein [Sphingobacteriales bacterium]
MKKLFTLLCFVFAIKSNAQAQALPNWTWTKQYGCNTYAQAKNITVDDAGNVYTLAMHEDSITIGTAHYSTPKTGDTYGILVKHDRNGQLLYSKNFRATPNFINSSYLHLNAIAADEEENIYVAGAFCDTLTVGNIKIFAAPTHGPVSFISKTDRNGNMIWLKRISSSPGDEIKDMKIDNDGDIVIAGTYTGHSHWFGSFYFSTPNGGTYLFVGKLNSAGTFGWVKSSVEGDAYPTKLAIDDANNIIIGGYDATAFTLDGTNYIGQGGYSLFFLKYNASGTFLWSSIPQQSINSMEVMGMAVDKNGDFYATGRYGFDGSGGDAAIDFTPTISLSDDKGYNYYLVKYNSAGVAQRAWGFSTNNQILTLGLVTDLNNNCYLGGEVYGPWTYKNTVVAYEAFNKKMGITAFGPSGNILWQKFEADARPANIAIDKANNIVVAATYGGFAGGHLVVGDSVLTGIGQVSFFTSKLAAQELIVVKEPFQQNYCKGDTIYIPYTTVDTVFKPGNILFLELSEPTGSFANAITIATKTTVRPIDSFAYVVPLTIAFNRQYRFRIISNAPNFYAWPNDTPVAMYDIPGKPNIMKTGASLQSDLSATSYQWMKNNVAIPGATQNVYTPVSSGTYKVIIYNNQGCENISDAFYYAPTGISTVFVKEDKGVLMYPNPTAEPFIKIVAENAIDAVSIYDITGRLVITNNYYKTLNAQVDIHMLSTGTYIVEITTATGRVTKKLVVTQ